MVEDLGLSFGFEALEPKVCDRKSGVECLTIGGRTLEVGRLEVGRLEVGWLEVGRLEIGR